MSDHEKTQAMVKQIRAAGQEFDYYHIKDIAKIGLPDPQGLPYSIKILLENSLRHCDGLRVTLDDIKSIAGWQAKNPGAQEVAFFPGRVILQDFTGVPCLVDLAAMRSAMHRLGGDYRKINPQVPCDLIIDHSLQIDAFGSKEAYAFNLKKEFERNLERYQFLKWGQNVFKGLTVVPPATGIIHQVNLEYLAQGVLKKETGKDRTVIYPDSCIGTDSHTTMINGLGVVGWGVGGIEAEAVMLGEPLFMLLPEVVGFRLTGSIPQGVTATDVVLTVTQTLRAQEVVGKFVEFFGPGLSSLSLPDRATIANMAPEYGATMGLFPVDEETIQYYRLTGRKPETVDLFEMYMKEQGLFYDSRGPVPEYSQILELDLSSVVASLAGPKRPQDRIPLTRMKEEFTRSLTASVKERGFGLTPKESANILEDQELQNGSLVIASITSCTNTSNPAVLIAAGLLAQKAAAKGLTVPKYVKTSFAPGSQVVEDYLSSAGLMPALESLGFHIVGYGCATCIGNSGPLPENVARQVEAYDLVVASVLSGNRNFEGRINPLTRANYLASPPLVVAFALAGRVDIDLDRDPLGKGSDGNNVFLKDIWPSLEEVQGLVARHVTAESFARRYKNVYQGQDLWSGIDAVSEDLFAWDESSSYIQEPPFFDGLADRTEGSRDIRQARVLVKVGDSVTTDHISPAGAISTDSPAGKYLTSLGIATQDFNSYGSRRGNDRVMTRGTFANIRLRNQLAPGTEGSWTTFFPDKEIMSIYDAARLYQAKDVPLLVVAGKEYGTGSSRDWAAKGTALLGVKAVLAESYERIHRSNLAGMGVLPLTFLPGQSASKLNLTGEEIFDLSGISQGLQPRSRLKVSAVDSRGQVKEFEVICRLDTPVEIEYYRCGGILNYVIKKLLRN